MTSQESTKTKTDSPPEQEHSQTKKSTKRQGAGMAEGLSDGLDRQYGGWITERTMHCERCYLQYVSS
eukprot:scaffold17271_cov69-Cyclotella_meneghiniana.AAC.5